MMRRGIHQANSVHRYLTHHQSCMAVLSVSAHTTEEIERTVTKIRKKGTKAAGKCDNMNLRVWGEK